MTPHSPTPTDRAALTALGSDDASASRLNAWTPWVVAVVASIVVLAVRQIQDYRVYIDQWDHVPFGGDPWLDATGHWNGNAYGPLHALLAWPALVSIKLPRLMFVAAWAWMGSVVIRRRDPWLWALYWLSPFAFTEVVLFSHNDAPVAVLCLCALLLAERDRPVASGAALAAAIAIKLYPLALLPFFAVRDRRLAWRWIASCVLVVLAIHAAAFALWGDSVWVPFRVAVGRPSDCYSFFYLLRTAGLDVDAASLPLLALSGAIVWTLYVVRRWPLAHGVILGFCVVMLFYKVGHWQFHLFLYFAIVYQWARDPDLPLVARRAILTYAAWMGVSSITYMACDFYEGPFYPLRWIGCIPATFALGYLFVGLARGQRAERRARRQAALQREPARPDSHALPA
jgi:hypothetical protein